MKTGNIKKTSVFAGTEDNLFAKLKDLKTLQHIAYPYATFTPNNGALSMQWTENETAVFQLKIFGFLPFGAHTIRVKEFNEETHRIYTEESNPYVPIWNHRITLEALDDQTTRYTDEVEIQAGRKTFLIYLWANCFYAHRQRKWKKLLKDEP